MIEKKLEALFNMLDEDEIKTVESSEINTECDIDPIIHARITSAVSKKTMPAEITVISAVKKRSMGKRLKAILIAAAIFIVLTIGVGATYQFIMPDRLTEELALNDVGKGRQKQRQNSSEDSKN